MVSVYKISSRLIYIQVRKGLYFTYYFCILMFETSLKKKNKNKNSAH